jgi:Zn finger protein HypA/HybF involved in hydrogenase expression
MHDYHAVKALIDRLMADGASPSSIAEVRIRASARLSPEALQQAYEMLAQGTPLEGSRLVVDPSRDQHTCPACQGPFPITPDDLAGHLLVCPACGAVSATELDATVQVVSITDRRG